MDNLFKKKFKDISLKKKKKMIKKNLSKMQKKIDIFLKNYLKNKKKLIYLNQ